MGRRLHHVGRVAGTATDGRCRPPVDENTPKVLTEDLRQVARRVMVEDGFNPDPDPAMRAELGSLGKRPDTGAPLRDMRDLLWSSIDNDDTRDLDQIEFAEEA